MTPSVEVTGITALRNFVRPNLRSSTLSHFCYADFLPADAPSGISVSFFHPPPLKQFPANVKRCFIRENGRGERESGAKFQSRHGSNFISVHSSICHDPQMSMQIARCEEEAKVIERRKGKARVHMK